MPVTLAAVVAYCMVALSFMILRKKAPDMPRPYKVPAYRFFGAMAVIMSGFMVCNVLHTGKRRITYHPGVGHRACMVCARRGIFRLL